MNFPLLAISFVVWAFRFDITPSLARLLLWLHTVPLALLSLLACALGWWGCARRQGVMRQHEGISTDLCKVFQASQLVLVQIKGLDGALLSSLFAWVFVGINRD